MLEDMTEMVEDVTEIAGITEMADNADIVDLFICQPHRVTSGLFTSTNLTQVKYQSKQTYRTITNIKYISQNSISGVALVYNST